MKVDNISVKSLIRRPFSFDIFGMREDECEVEFRFKKEDIFRLAAALQLPNTFKCQNGVVADNVDGLCIA